MDIKKSVKVSLAVAGKKQGDLAKHMSITNSTLSQKLRLNRVTCRQLAEIASFFGIPVSEFVARGELQEKNIRGCGCK